MGRSELAPAAFENGPGGLGELNLFFILAASFLHALLPEVSSLASGGFIRIATFRT